MIGKLPHYPGITLYKEHRNNTYRMRTSSRPMSPLFEKVDCIHPQNKGFA